MRPLGRLPRVVGTSLSFSRQRRRGEEDAVVVVIEVDNSLTMNFIPPPTTTPLILLCDQPSRIGAQLVSWWGARRETPKSKRRVSISNVHRY